MDADRWQRLEALFVGALERDEPGRHSFLRRETIDDPTLYAEVAAMLAANGESRALAVESQLIRDTPVGSPFIGRVDRAIPSAVGPYRLIEQIGHGGMGVVYRAERADGQYTQTVAVKLVRTDFASPDLVQRSRSERQILARLEHASIARLLDGAMAEDGSPYLVMEYVSGRPITEHCDAACLTIDERLRLFQIVCRAVHYAHQNLVVHRDLKPSNILVTADGQVKLLDFGIAKLIATDDDTATTRTLLPLMTPDYASPEQVRGESITTATDVYALGLLLYELLCGERAQRASGASPVAIERTVCQVQPPSPSVSIGTGSLERIAERVRSRGAARVEQLQKTIRGDLDTIVDAALRKEPARRYASAEQLAGDIERFLTGLPVLARPDTVRYRAAKFVRRNRTGVLAAAAIVLSIMAGLTVALVGLTRARQAERQAVAEAAAATTVSEFLVDLFRANDPGESRGEVVTARQLLDRGAARIGDGLDDQPAVQARLLGTMARAYESLGLFDPAIELRERELEIHRGRVGELSVEVGTTLGELSDLYGRRGEYARARDLAREAVELLEQVPAASGREMMNALNQLGMANGQLGDLQAARGALERSLAIGERTFGRDDPSFTGTLNNLAIVHWLQGDPAGARPLYARALAILEREHGTEHPAVAHTLNNLGLVQSQAGELDAAVATHRRALAVREKILAPDHPDIAETLNNLGVVMLSRRDFAGAKPLFERALDIRERALGADHSHVASTLNNLGTALLELGDHTTARPHLERALASLRRSVGPDHVMTSYPLLGLARIERARGNVTVAERDIRRVIAMREAVGAQHPDLAIALHELAELARDRGRTAEADSLQQRADLIRAASRGGA